MPPYRPIEDRLMDKIDVRGPDECWPWLGACGGTGRPMIHVRLTSDGKRVIEHASRVMYRLRVEEPGDRHVHHTCKNSMCVNPAHLVALAEGEHMKLHTVTHCKYGHEYTVENTRPDAQRPGVKHCRQCARDRQKRLWVEQPDKMRAKNRASYRRSRERSVRDTA